jgi:hypothetical protein
MKFNIKKEHKPYIIGGLAVIVIYFLFRRKKLLPTKAETATATELITEQATTAATYPNSQYQTWANQLETAMDDIGTDENTIISIFKNLKNNTDYLKLFQAFGTRKYTGGYLPGWANDSWDLGQWLVEELDSEEITQINNELASKGITYRIS